MTPLAIVGIGCLFPKANRLGAYWANLKAGTDAITEIPPTHWRPEDYFDADPKKPDFTYARRGGFLDPYPFNPVEFGIAPNDLEATDTTQLLGLVAARMALRDAGYGPDRAFDRNRVSVILGVTGTLELVVPLGARLGHPHWRRALKAAGVADDVADDVVQRIGDAYVPWKENSFPGLLGNVVAGRIANRLDLGGTNCVVDAACASSLSAIHLAGLELAAGRCDVAVTGGADTFNDIFMYMCFSKTPALSPTGNARPFDAAGDGTILGEGIGLVVLKRLADAERDGDRVYAVLRGMGSSSDGKGNAIYAPAAEGQVRAMKAAYEQAGISPSTVELVEAHGTGTKVGDAAEIQSLTEVYHAARPEGTWCALGSVKSQIGHTKAAAGAAGLIKAALALYHKVLPPTIKVDRPADALAPGKTPFYVNTVKRPWLLGEHPRRAAVSAFGFGGSNFHAVLEEHRPEKPAVDWDGNVQIVALSSESLEGLKADLAKWSNWETVRANAADSRRAFRADAAFRLVLVATETELGKVLDAGRKLLETRSGEPFAHSPDGAFYGRGPVAGKLAMLFPGQGSQAVGMLRDLACQFPEMRPALAASGTADRVYPHPAFTPEAKAEQDRRLRSTDVAQPAIGAVSLGAAKVLERFGVVPDAAAGHSYGELTALCVAGAFDADTFVRLSQLRGRLMAAAPAGDPGTMLAVHAPLADIERTVADERLDVVIANRNAPSQAVLSGPTPSMESAAQAFAAKSIRTTRLPVAAAFHSPLVASAEGPFRAALDEASMTAPRIPVIANTTATAYPGDLTEVRRLLAGQLVKPVDFVGSIAALVRLGVRTFVEVGPGSVLSRLTEATLAEVEPKADVFALDSGKRSGIVDLACVLARLAARGYAVHLGEWESGPWPPPEPAPTGKPAMTVPICGANYVKPNPPRPPRPAPAANHVPSTNGKVVPVSEPVKPAAPAAPPALQLTHDGLAAFQKLQEQTAQLHRQFLQGQEAAQQTLGRLIEQQQQLALASLGVAPPPPTVVREVAPPPLPPPPPTPAPRFVAPPPLASSREAASGTPSSNRVRDVLLAVVSEKTGYPPEMLDPNMGLDADLGIDSIKRVEILSALQERLPDAPPVKPEHIGTLHTLADIVAFLSGGTPPPLAASREAASGAPSSNRVKDVLLAVVSEKTGYPPEMLDPTMGLDADLGIDSIKRVEILSALQERFPDAPQVKPEHIGTLHTLAHIIDFLSGAPAPAAPVTEKLAPFEEPPRPTGTLSRRVLKPVERSATRPRMSMNGPVAVVADDTLGDELSNRLPNVCRYRWSDAPPATDRLAGLVLIAPPGDVDDAFPLAAFRWVRTLGPALKDGFLATVSRMDGAFGVDRIDPIREPLAGGLAGLAKTAAHEWPDVACKAIDFAAGASVEALADEVTRNGPVEVGLSAGRRVELALEETPLPPVVRTLFGATDVIAISGGARGVTAEAAVALAEAYRPTLVLLGRSPAPEPEPSWLVGLTDEPAIKRAVAANHPGKLTPRQLGDRYGEIAAQREVRRNLTRIEAAGARVLYRAVDVRDADAVDAALAWVRDECGPITGLIHGAGVLADRRIADLTDDQFSRVYATKVEGLRNLLRATGNDPLKAVALFSSSTGRFGRTGQAAYAVANEVLNKFAQCAGRRRPECRVVAVNWGPWAGGMVTPALERVFEQEGIGTIPLAEGARYLVGELSAADRAVEVVVGVDRPRPPEPEPTAALDRVFERDVDAAALPVLTDHVLDGKAVLPMALHAEWLAHAALHGNPGLLFHGFNDLRVCSGIAVGPDERHPVSAFAGRAVKRDGLFVVPVELRGRNRAGRDVVHSRANVVLAATLPSAPTPEPVGEMSPYPRPVAEAYADVLFHGPALHGLETIEGSSDRLIVGTAHAAPPPAEWEQRPLRSAWIADPLVLDSAFQLEVLWNHARFGAVALPCFAARYRQYRRAFPAGVRIVVRANAEGSVTRSGIEFLDPAGADIVARFDGYESVRDPALAKAYRKNRWPVPV